MAFRNVLRVTAKAALLGSGIGAVYMASDKDRRETAIAAADGTVRFTRAAWHGSRTMLLYHELDATEEANKAEGGKRSAAYIAKKKEIDLIAARRLLDVSKVSGGVYVKLCQYLSTLNHMLPPEWTETLAEVQDRAASKPWSDVCRVFVEDTGKPPEEVFASIDETPIAAASLAQVHKAVTKQGQAVAVKIQYPGLRRQVANDMQALKLFLSIIETVFPEHAYSWLWPEFHQSITSELNFLQEASNGERVSRMFAGRHHVHIPAVLHDLSTERVLCMEFINGVKVNDLAAIRALGVRPSDVAAEVSRFFGDQIHLHGFVHCDPHPGNLMVRRAPDARGRPTGDWQLVILDHGMYRKLSAPFRAAYCRLWKALVTRDTPLGERAAVELGLEPGAYNTLSLILTFRSASSSGSLGGRMSAADIKKLKKDWETMQQSGNTASDINRFVQRLPRDMLFVLRGSNMVRALNKDLGGTSRQRLRVMGECAIRGLILTDALDDFSAQAQEFLKQQQAALPEAERARLRQKEEERRQRQIEAELHALRQREGRSPSAAAVAEASAATSASIVAEVETKGLADAEKPASGARSVLSLLWAFLTNLGREPPREAMTYLNALAAHAVHTEPTESELLMERQRAGLGHIGLLSLVKAPRLAVRKLRAEASVWGLWIKLWQMDVLLAVLTAMGSFQPNEDPHRPAREAG